VASGAAAHQASHLLLALPGAATPQPDDEWDRDDARPLAVVNTPQALF